MLSYKELVRKILKTFIACIENHFSTTVKVVRSDNGTEILQSERTRLFVEKGMVHQRSATGVPHKNGRVKRKHRHLNEIE